MDSAFFFNTFFGSRMGQELTQESIQELYGNELKDYIASYKKLHPGCSLWIHEYSEEEHLFFVNGQTVSFITTMVRLKYHGGENDGATFTFMGSLFTRGSKFSKQFILASITRGKETASARADASSRTLQRWRDAFRLHMELFSHSIANALAKYSVPVPDAASSSRMCLSILLDEQGHFPLWVLH